jgi:hypothetical protein
LTVTVWPSILAVTPFGSGTGFLPILDIVRAFHSIAGRACRAPA